MSEDLTKLSSDFNSLLESGKYSDVTLVVGGKEFVAHKVILMSRSPVFAAMFAHDTKEKNENVVEITDLDTNVFEQLLSYIYTGNIQSLDQVAFGLFSVADKYQLDSLKSICEQHLCANLTESTVSDILLLADMHQASELRSKCLKYIKANVKTVKDTKGWKALTTARPDLAIELLLDLVCKTQDETYEYSDDSEDSSL